MKKTRKSHFTPPIHSLSVEELGAYIEDRLSPEDRRTVDEFLEENPLYRETLMILQESYEADKLEGIQEVERRYSAALSQKAEKIRPIYESGNDPAAPRGTDAQPLGSTWKAAPQEQPINNPSSTLWYSTTWFKMAASLVLVAGISLVFLGERLFTPEAVRIAEENLIHFDPNVTMSGTHEEAIGLYNAKKYGEAIPLLEKALQEDPNSSLQAKLSMYLGVSHTKIDQLPEAIPYFQAVMDSSNPYSLDARWYLSLVYTSIEEYTQAKSLLKPISEYRPKNRRQTELVENAKKLWELLP
ncbi:MAG: tetratricopeptide repeat protein [Bacteroidota bacterium]